MFMETKKYIKKIPIKIKIEYATKTILNGLSLVMATPLKLIQIPFNFIIENLAVQSLTADILADKAKQEESKRKAKIQAQNLRMLEVERRRRERLKSGDYLTSLLAQQARDERAKLSKLRAEAGRKGGKKTKNN